MADIFEWKEKGSVSPAAGWSFVTGNFTGNALADVAAYHPSDGSLWVGSTTGGDFLFTQWATVDPASGWTFQVGDFTRNGRLDIVGHYTRDGSVWVGRNTGSSFAFGAAAYTTPPAEGWTLIAGNFSEDGATDLGAYLGDTGSSDTSGTFRVGRSTLAGDFFFAGEPWATLSPSSGWTLVP